MNVADLILQAHERVAGGEDPLDGLHPDLEPYLVDTPVGIMLKHPLVFSLLPIAEMVNVQYEYKQRAVEEAIEAGDWCQVMWLYERPYRLDMVLDWWETNTTSLGEHRELLQDAWIDCEFPYHTSKTRLVRAFKSAGYLSDNLHDPPTQSFVVYRGTTVKGRTGLSWTRDPAVAAWFADRYHDGGVVYRAIILPRGILATFLDRGEAEVVVNYRVLKSIERFDRANL